MKHGPLNPELHRYTSQHPKPVSGDSAHPVYLWHIGAVNKVTTPDGYESSMLIGLCGRVISLGFSEDDTSMFYTDGLPARQYCEQCKMTFDDYLARNPTLNYKFRLESPEPPSGIIPYRPPSQPVVTP